MNARRRKPGNEDLPANVYKMGEYYKYVHPVDHWSEPLGKIKEEAVRRGKLINAALEKQGINTLQREPVIKGKALAEVAKEYLPIATKDKKPNSARNIAGYIKRIIQSDLAKKPIRAITVLHINEFLKDVPDNTYIRLRYHLEEIFKHALATGTLHHNAGNPASVIARKSEPKAKRERLTLDDYKRIHEAAPVWLRVLMDIMLHTSMRPSQALSIKFENVRDGLLYTEVFKVSKHQLLKLSPDVLKIIENARDDIVSPFVVHALARRGKKGNKAHPTQITLDRASRTFSNLRRELKIGGDHPPTLYEIRSLSLWLYEKQRGKEHAQKLAAHSDEKMTDLYLSRRDSEEIIYIEAGLKL